MVVIRHKGKLIVSSKRARVEGRRIYAPRAKTPYDEEMKKRALRILDLRLTENLTCNKIGALQKPKITGERVRQILAQLADETGIEIPSFVKVSQMITTHCVVCNKELIKPRSQFKRHGFHKCMSHIRKYYTLEEQRAASAKRSNWRYHNDPAFRAKHVEYVKKYHLRTKDDPEVKRKFNAYQASYKRKKKTVLICTLHQ